MKKYIIRKTWLLLFVLIAGCIETEDMMTGNVKEGGMIEINDKIYRSIIYSQGLPKEYAITMRVMQGKGIYTPTVNIYKSFYNSVDDVWTNETLLSTYEVPKTSGATGVNATFDFSDLREGLEMGGDPFPVTDATLAVGDYWQLRIESVLNDGRKVNQVIKPKVVVSGRYAGTYRVVESEYYRIGVYRPDVAWPSVITMESINNTTYKQVDYFGPFPGSSLYWTIDGNLDIDYPVAFNGVNQNSANNPLVTCSRDAALTTNVHCSASNFAVNNDVNGKDRLIMSYGYNVDGSGSREMYQVLEKVVD